MYSNGCPARMLARLSGNDFHGRPFRTAKLGIVVLPVKEFPLIEIEGGGVDGPA